MLRTDQVERYARHLLLKDVGGQGQAKLLNARVLIVGAGGLGSPVLMYLAAAGVGTLGIVDDDRVELSNLQRQIVHMTSSVGELKTRSAAATVQELNPDVKLELHPVRLDADNAEQLIGEYDIVADGSDSFETRALVNDVCYRLKKTLVAGAVGEFEGQLSTFKAHLAHEPKYPCYKCLYPEAPPPGLIPTCAEAGILGAITGVVGTLQAMEVIKEILQIGDGLAGRLLLFDGLGASFRTVTLKADPECPTCGAG